MTYYDQLHERIECEAESMLSETLSDRLAADLANAIADEVVRQERRGVETRYVLIDLKSGQLESRVLYEEFEVAEKEAVELSKRHNDPCFVATLLCSV
jgi:hypothetical protein